MARDWIQAHPSGRKVHPLRPDPTEFDIRDIARSLSMLCRYNGHVERFFSVAEHSVHVSRIVEARGAPLHVIKSALLHDASEAYLADIPSPLKYSLAFEDHRAAERWVHRVLMEWAGVPTGAPIIQLADKLMLATEARQLKQPVHPEWGLGEEAPEMRGVTLGLAPFEAEEFFLNRYEALFDTERTR